MKIYNTKQELLNEDVATLVEIIMYQNCILSIPHIQMYMKDNATVKAKKQCQCCAEFCCIKFPMDK
jgi:hypothetical protein